MKAETLSKYESLVFVGNITPAPGSKTEALIKLHEDLGIIGIQDLKLASIPPTLLINGAKIEEATEIIQDFISTHPKSELQVRTDIGNTAKVPERRNLPSAQALTPEQVIPATEQMLQKLISNNKILPQDAIIVVQALPEQSIARNTWSFQILRDSSNNSIYHIELRIGSATAMARGNQSPDIVINYDKENDTFTVPEPASLETQLDNIRYNLIFYGLQRLRTSGISKIAGKRLRTEELPLYNLVEQMDIKNDIQALFREIDLERIRDFTNTLNFDPPGTLREYLSWLGLWELFRDDTLVDEHNLDRERIIALLNGKSALVEIPNDVLSEIYQMTKAVTKFKQPTCLKASVCRIPKPHNRFAHKILIWDLIKLPPVTQIGDRYILDGKSYYLVGLPLRDENGNIVYTRVENGTGEKYYLHFPTGIIFTNINQIPLKDQNVVKLVCHHEGD